MNGNYEDIFFISQQVCIVKKTSCIANYEDNQTVFEQFASFYVINATTVVVCVVFVFLLCCYRWW